MSSYIQVEVELVMSSFSLGILLMISYDCLRLFRLLIPHGNFWIGIEDFVYWLYSAFMTFSMLFHENNGILRGYIVVCVFLGMLLYDRIVSQSVFGFLKKVGRWITMKKKRWKAWRKERKNERKT